MIAVERLTKAFGRTIAVSDVSFRAATGEIVGLLGPNGSGKTTIMRAIAGYFPPTAGHIEIAGIDVCRARRTARDLIGYLPEHAAWYPDMRVDEFLGFCADVRRLRGAGRRARLAAVVDTCGLSDVQRRLIGHLSRGYRQRLGIAQAILHDPAVLILDEPTVGLDPRQLVEIRALVRSLRGRTTVLLSTHVLAEVSSACDRVVIIDCGRVIAEGSTAALTRAHQGAERLSVRVAGPPGEVAAAVRGLPEVAEVITEPSDGDIARLLVTARPGPPPAPAIAAAVVARGWGLIEMRPLALSLEELFVRLTAGGERRADSAGA
ncbi:MAG: ABC transporter ATP-binding protein [Candidatus Binatia bacterium]